jgi:hypothetical protein
MFTAYGILKNNETLLTTIKVEEKDALSLINRQFMLWQQMYSDCNLRVVKVAKRADDTNKSGWSILD